MTTIMHRHVRAGRPWWGILPDGWLVSRLRYHVNVNPPKTEIKDIPGTTEVSFVPMEAVQEYGGLQLDRTRQLDSVLKGYTYFCEDDIVVAKITPSFENGKGAIAIGLRNGVGFGTTELHVLRSHSGLDRDFLFYLTVCHAFRQIGTAYMYGAAGQKRVPQDFIKDFLCPHPPFETQRMIATFLNHRMKYIDSLIKGKYRQIDILLEKRKAVITHAVIKGVDSEAKIKDSGIGWLGEIPEHWEVKKLKYIATANFSNVDKHVIEGEEPIRLCNYTDVYYNDYINDDLELMSVTAKQSEIEKFSIKSGDVIITKDSETWDDIAVPAYVPEDLPGVLCGYHLAQIRPDEKQADGEYLFRAFYSQGINEQFQIAALGVTRYGLAKYELENAIFPVPPKMEQHFIAAFLARQTKQIDMVVDKIKLSIDLLHEYRDALIIAAITGEINTCEENT